jgi:hypothetical protein
MYRPEPVNHDESLAILASRMRHFATFCLTDSEGEFGNDIIDEDGRIYLRMTIEDSQSPNLAFGRRFRPDV